MRWSQIWRVGRLGYNSQFRLSPENCAQGKTSELVHCRGATPNSGSSTTEASSGVRLLSKASELLRDFSNLSDSQTAILGESNHELHRRDRRLLTWNAVHFGDLHQSTFFLFLNDCTTQNTAFGSYIRLRRLVEPFPTFQ